MSLINLKLSNKEIINSYFLDLCCDNYSEPLIQGGQSNADLALHNLDITNYSKLRNNVYPKSKRGSSYLSAYIRHGLLDLREVWKYVEIFKYEDKTKYRDELLWQEFSRHLYAIIGKKSQEFLNYSINSKINKDIDTQNMNCINTVKKELEETGYMVNQTRMWFASHFSLREQGSWNKNEDYMFKHLVDGSRFANRLGWHWVMGSQTGKVYGFSKFQVQKRAKKLCDECELNFKCPINEWPQNIEITKKNISLDVDIYKNFGPKEIKSNASKKPSFVWITAESLGDDDPAMKYFPNLPVVFIFDKKLLLSLKISTKRINFLLECLKEISLKRDLTVVLDDPMVYLKNKQFASTFAPVPKYKKITNVNQPIFEFPTQRLAQPIDFYPNSFSSWKKRVELNI
jgi:deoxyribodipyrimidine photo-lyase